MNKFAIAFGSVGLSLLVAQPVFAQSTTAGTTAAAPATTMTGPNGRLEKFRDEWRASKLVGANVYNDNGQSIGSIDDLMIGNDGKISNAVLSVGGFLGMGGKLVEVPFDQFKFVQSRRNEVVSPAAPAAVVGTTAPTAAPASAAAMQEPTYYSIVLPSATKESLSSAAGFKYNG